MTYREVTMDDFLTGLFASLAASKISTVSMRSTTFYRAAERAYQVFKESAAKEHMPLDFVVRVRKMYQDSPELRQGIARAVQRDVIGLDNPVYMKIRLRISPEDAPAYLATVPGKRDWYAAAAAEFIDVYRGY